MTRMMLVVMGALLGSGCAARTLQDETQPVGATCPRTTRGMISGTYMCPSDVNPESMVAVYEFRPENGALHVAMCNAGVAGSLGGAPFHGNFHFTVREPTLGTHTLPADTSSLGAACDGCDSWTNTGGTIEVEGYDPTTRTVCGTFDIPLRQRRGTNTRRDTGTFVAIIP